MGIRIRRAREIKSMTQEALGEICGLSTAHIGHIERGTRIPSLETIFKIATSLNISIDALVFDSYIFDENLFAHIIPKLQGKNAKKIKNFVNTISALADKIDEL